MSREPPAMPEIPAGSKVRVTGVAILDDGNPFNGAMAFGILLRSANDVAVILYRSWLTVRNLSRVVGLLVLIVVAVSVWGWMMRRRVRQQTAALATRIEAEAVLERRRSAILEDINGGRPLVEILEKIAALVSFNLNGAACRLQLADGESVGDCGRENKGLEVMRQEIHARSGPLHGIIFGYVDPQSSACATAPDALSMGSWLATLAIETRGLFSDLVHRSEFDLLTDIHNRFSMEKRLQGLIDGARQNDRLFGLIYIDLDDFKQVNDLYGHGLGDLYLQETANRLKRQLRPGDMLARLGGDEFAALVSAAGRREEVEVITRRLEHCFDEPYELEGCTLCGSASFGIAIYGADGNTKDELLNAADAAMYRDKHSKAGMVSQTAAQEA